MKSRAPFEISERQVPEAWKAAFSLETRTFSTYAERPVSRRLRCACKPVVWGPPGASYRRRPREASWLPSFLVYTRAAEAGAVVTVTASSTATFSWAQGELAHRAGVVAA